MADEVIFLEDNKVKINFTKSNEQYSFSDALHFTQEEYATLTEQDIENMKQQRFDNWYAIITYVPTEEELAAKAALEEQQRLEQEAFFARLAEEDRLAQEAAALEETNTVAQEQQGV